jgi:FtsZ-interacting cell division protein ZipA
MSDLQIMLIVIGALIIVAVIIVNWWQERRFHLQVERSFSPLAGDVLLDGSTIDDPKLDVSKFDESDSYTSMSDPDLDHFAFDSTQGAHTFHDAIHPLEDNISKDEPLISVSSDRFVKLTQDDSSENGLTEDISIDAAYSQLSNAISNGLSARGLGANLNEIKFNNADLSAEMKPAQHDDIKAIFDEAFSQTNKAPTAFEQAPTVESSFKPTKLEAVANVLQINPEKVPNPNSIPLDVEPPVLSLPAMLHAQMDLTALLYLAAETSAGTLNDSLTGLFDGYDKPIFVHALTANKQWCLLKEVPLNQQVSKVACSLQLADRAGAVSRNMLNRFQLAVETLGLDINAHVEWQSAGDPLATATALDTFCIEVDKTMGFHLVHGENGAFTGTKLRGLAEAQGFTLASDGTFKYYDDAAKQSSDNPKAQLSFVMFNREDNPFNPEMLRSSVVKGVTFQLDIPHVKQCAEAFTQMVQVAKQMEIGLNALLVDDNNKVLSDIQIEKIRHQLKVIHATMLVRGIIPGSDSALRLFS